MKKENIMALTIFLVFTLLTGLYFYQQLQPSLSAVRFLNGEGYTSVRIIRQMSPAIDICLNDKYRYVFDASRPPSETRTEGYVCGNGEGSWYEVER